MRISSLERQLLLHISLVLVASCLVMGLWLWGHLKWSHEAGEKEAIYHAFLELTSNTAWLLPLALGFVLGVTALTLRRRFAIVREISAQAKAIEPGNLQQRLPLEGVPEEILPLVAATNSMLEQIEQGFERQRLFAEHAAHELRTPLQMLSAGLEQCPQSEQIVALRKDLARMVRSVEQVLAISRLGAATLPAETRADLNVVASEVLTSLAPLAVRRQVLFSLERSSKPVWVFGDATLIGDLLRNLIDNALAVSPAQSSIDVLVTERGELFVADRGPGIADQHKALVFQRFWRPPGNQKSGSGLGLAIVQSIAEHCEAMLELTDREGGGCQFRLVFKRV